MEKEELIAKVMELLEKRELPEDLRNIVQETYNECVDFYTENIGNAVRLRNVEDYFKGEYSYLRKRIEQYYKDTCTEKSVNFIQCIYSLEDGISNLAEEDEISNLAKEEKIADSIDLNNGNSNKNKYNHSSYTDHAREDYIASIIIDTIADCRNRLMQSLSNYTVEKSEKEEIDYEISKIKNNVKEKMETRGLDSITLDNDQIREIVLNEYRKYQKANQQENQEENQTPHQKFASTLQPKDENSENVEIEPTNDSQPEIKKSKEERSRTSETEPDVWLR